MVRGIYQHRCHTTQTAERPVPLTRPIGRHWGDGIASPLLSLQLALCQSVNCSIYSQRINVIGDTKCHRGEAQPSDIS
jgi:hypothetical protein